MVEVDVLACFADRAAALRVVGGTLCLRGRGEVGVLLATAGPDGGLERSFDVCCLRESGDEEEEGCDERAY